MELRQLRHFVAAVECGNLSTAAERVLISQPALSRSIKSLEDHLGARLLDRLPRGVVPTAAGEAFFREAKFILNECGQARAALSAFRAGKAGSLAIGVVPMFATHILPDVLTRLVAEAPDVDISVVEGLTDDLLEQAVEGRVDLLFTTLLPTRLPRGLTAEPLFTVTSAVAVGSAGSTPRKRALRPEDLKAVPWVLVRQGRDDGVSDYVVEQYLAQNQVPAPERVLHTSSLPLLKELVLNHGYASVVPEHIVAREVAQKEIRLLPTPTGPFQRPAGLVYREDSGARALIDRAIAVFRSVAAQGR